MKFCIKYDICEQYFFNVRKNKPTRICCYKFKKGNIISLIIQIQACTHAPPPHTHTHTHTHLDSPLSKKCSI